jgi:uncharacterized protein (DUF58 family)
MPEKQSALLKYFDAAALARVTAIGFKPGGVVEGTLVGNHRSPFHGFAIEFAGHRQYVQGDDLKHFDWNVYYRSDKSLIRQYVQETNFVGHILIDVSETMTFTYKENSKRDLAAFIAVTLAGAIVAQSDMAAVTFFADRVLDSVPATGSDEIVAKISRFMSEAPFKDTTAIGRVLSLLSEQIGRRKCVFVISDFFNDLDRTFDGIKRLLFNHNEVILLHLLDPLEIDFSYKGQVELIELEGEGRLVVEGRTIRDSYNRIFGEYLADIRDRSRKLGIDYLLCDTSENFGVTLAKYLNTRVARRV